jgi:hypothetical protein
MRPTRLCRIAYLVDDMSESVRRFGEVLGLSFRTVELGDLPLKVSIGEHGFEPLQSTGFSFAPIEGPSSRSHWRWTMPIHAGTRWSRAAITRSR